MLAFYNRNILSCFREIIKYVLLGLCRIMARLKILDANPMKSATATLII
jgi:hypothetical protein